MKQIHILYNNHFSDAPMIADQLCTVLTNSGLYECTLVCLDTKDDIRAYISRTTPANCQLILSINMAGYELNTTGNSTAFNSLTMNIVNYINCDLEHITPFLKHRLNYTMSFLFSSETTYNIAKHQFPHVRNMHSLQSTIVECISKYLTKLDWRY